MQATLRNKSTHSSDQSQKSSKKQLNTTRFSNLHQPQQNQLNTRIISETSSSGVHSGHSETNSDRGSNSDRGGGTSDHKNRDKPSKTNTNSSKTSKPQDHRIVREPNCSGSNSSNSFNNRPNSMVLEQRAPRMPRGRTVCFVSSLSKCGQIMTWLIRYWMPFQNKKCIV